MSIQSRYITYQLYRSGGKSSLGTSLPPAFISDVEMSISLQSSLRETTNNVVAEGHTHIAVTESADILINDTVRSDSRDYKVLYVQPATKFNLVFLKEVI